MGNFFFKEIYFFFMELVSWRDEFPFKRFHLLKFEKMILVLKKFIRSPSFLFPRWQKLLYICNNFFYYNNLSITFLNYRNIEKSPTTGGCTQIFQNGCCCESDGGSRSSLPCQHANFVVSPQTILHHTQSYSSELQSQCSAQEAFRLQSSVRARVSDPSGRRARNRRFQGFFSLTDMGERFSSIAIFSSV